MENKEKLYIELNKDDGTMSINGVEFTQEQTKAVDEFVGLFTTQRLKEFVEFIRKYLGERKNALGRLIDSNRRVQESLKYDDDKIAAEPVIRHEDGEWCGYDKVDYWLDQILEMFLEKKK